MGLENIAKLANDQRVSSNMQVNIFDAKTELSKLIKKLENNEEESIIIARNGKPVACLVPYTGNEVAKRIGIAKGKIPYIHMSDWEAMDNEIEKEFMEAVEKI